MKLVRERRHQQALRLSLPPPIPSVHFNCRAHRLLSLSLPASPESHRLPSLSLPASPESPAIDNLSDLEKLAVLGQGNGGTVYKVRHKHTNSILALKVLRFDLDATALRQQAVREAEILTLVDSPYIVRCHAVFDSDDDLCFVMEHMERGSLHDVLHVVKALSEDAISAVARQVLQGLQYLHSMQIVHGDIKPSNLLINRKGEVKIADFGASRRVAVGKGDAAYTNANNYMGTFAYMSPERFDSEAWSGDESADGFAGDVWSVGVVILECLVGRYPLIGFGEKPDWAALVCAICFGESLEMPNNSSEEFRSFVSGCLEKDWRKRGSVDELLHHPFVNNNSCCGGGATPGLIDFGLQG